MTQDTGARKKAPTDAPDARLRLRAFLWDFDRGAAFQPRVADCGRKRIAEYVTVRASGEASSLGGVSTCSSVWGCPCCSAKIAGQRSTELGDVIRAWQARGGSVLLCTFTLSHSKGHPLAKSWDALTVGWSGVRNGRGWREDKAAHRIAGYCRVVEVTHGQDNGWHPHAHVLLFVEGATTEASREQLRASMFGRWQTALAGVGYRTVEWVTDPSTGKRRALGVDVRHADPKTGQAIAEYVAKFGYTPRAEATSLSLEVARGDLKRGRRGSRTPWQVLESAAGGNAADSALWAEWERASHGKRQYAWSRGFVESLDLAAVLTDAEATEREDAHHEPVALLRPAQWAALLVDLRQYRTLAGAPLLSRLLGKAAELDAASFRAWLTRAGVEFVNPEDVAGAGPATPALPPANRRDGTYAAKHHRWLIRCQAHREAQRRGLVTAPVPVPTR